MGAGLWSGWIRGAILAEVGSIQMEFRYLSEQTGEPKSPGALCCLQQETADEYALFGDRTAQGGGGKRSARYADLANRAMDAIVEASGAHGIIPHTLSSDRAMLAGGAFTMGAMADSYYESAGCVRWLGCPMAFWGTSGYITRA